MSDATHDSRATRRRVLAGAGAVAGGLGLAGIAASPARAQAPVQVQANPADYAIALRKVVGDAKVNPGKVRLEIPPLSENGNTVPLSVTVDSPMTAKDYVKAIHVFSGKNPQPNVISATLGPRAGRASVQTRVRLFETQDVVAIAEMSDGTFWSGSAHAIVTLGACQEDAT